MLNDDDWLRKLETRDTAPPRVDTQQVCLNGHQITDSIHENPHDRRDFCTKCGERTITACQHCNASIPGHTYYADAFSTFTVNVPEHCARCGKPFPWTEKSMPDSTTLENDKDSESVQDDSPQVRKRESNLLKIIGGFVQTVYLQKETGAYRNGDKPKISAIANAFSEALHSAGYSDEGFKDRKLRETISEALKQIEENKIS